MLTAQFHRTDGSWSYADDSNASFTARPTSCSTRASCASHERRASTTATRTASSDRAVQAPRGIPGLLGVGIGFRFVLGRRTEELAVEVQPRDCNVETLSGVGR